MNNGNNNGRRYDREGDRRGYDGRYDCRYDDGRYDDSRRADGGYGDGRYNGSARDRYYDSERQPYRHEAPYEERERQNAYQTSRGQSGERFNVHISDEDFRREMAPRPSARTVSERGYRSGEPRGYDDRRRDNAPRRAQAKSEQPKGCGTAAIYAAAVCAVSVLLAFLMIIGFNDMFALVKDDISIEIVIPENADLNDVADVLKENNIVSHPAFFKMYARTSLDKIEPGRTFKSGTYSLSQKTDYFALVRKLTTPPNAKNNIVTVTIPEGKNVMQIADILDYNCVCDYDAFFDMLESHEWKHSYYPQIPAAENRIYKMEGYLFPATYDFYIGENPKYAINRLLNGFNDNVLNNSELDFEGRVVALSEKYGDSLGQPVNMDFIITMASIIEREAKSPEDMKMVASVFYNRLRDPQHDGIGRRLQSDATQWYPYATKKAMLESPLLSNKQKDSFTSPYNTANIIGLPPGPICCPGLNSIKAALNPADSKYYYFFSDSTGAFHYAATIDEFNSLLAKYPIN